MTGSRANWAGNVTYGAASYPRPAAVAQLQHLVAGTPRVRALGTGHSFSPLAATPGALISVAGLPPVIDIDTARGTVTVSAGLSYGDLAGPLHRAGRALPNLASLPGISIAGACATGTHGSGDTNGSLATHVSELDLVTAAGDLVTVRRPGGPGAGSPGAGSPGAGGPGAGGIPAADPFSGMVVALGALGIVTRLTLNTVPAFELRQYVYEGLPLQQVIENFGEITSAGYSVSLFTNWREPRINQAWVKVRSDASDPRVPGQSATGQQSPARCWMGGTLAASPRHPVIAMSAADCTQQLGVPGPWHERLPHFRAGATPSVGAELQSEYLVPAQYGPAALAALSQIAPRLAPVVQVSEIRTVAPDQLWLSPAYQQASAGFHFTWTADLPAVRRAIGLVEEQLAGFGPRPHWGKLFRISAGSVARRYPRLPDFRRLMVTYDAAGKFQNEMLTEYLLMSGLADHS